MKPLHLFILSLFIAVFQGHLSVAQNGHFSPHHPGCAIDEMIPHHEHHIREEIKDYLQNAVPKLSAVERNAAEQLISVAVVVHVIHEGEPIGTGRNISSERVRAQIDVLNEDFSSLNAKFHDTPSQWLDLAGTPNIQFCLATVDPDGNPTDGIDRVEMEVTGSSWNNNNINSVIKPAVNWDPEKYVNIYVVSIPGTTAAGGVVGYSNYPVSGLIGAPSDGPVVDYNWFGGPGFPSSGYRPITHEMGHYLGLPHPFNGTSCSNDDNIGDTPNIEESTRAYAQDLECSDGFPTGPNSCGNDHLYVNYMDYVTENCYTSFTQGQVNVMRSVLDGTANQFSYGSRHELVTNAPLLCNLPANDAGVVRLLSPAETYCTADSIAPQITLRNFGVNDLTSANILYRVNGGPSTEMEWQGSLFPGENIDLTLPAFLPPDGAYVMEIFTQNPNGQIDERLSNDTLTSVHFAYVALRPPVVEDFEDENSLPTSLGFFEFNPGSDDLFWEVSSQVSAFGEGSHSAFIDNQAAFNMPGTLGSIDALITRHFDLSEMENTELRFDVAYAPQSSLQSDTLLVLIATECSQNFNQLVFAKGGNQLSTAPPTSQAFTPTNSQWRTEVVDLSAYNGNEDVTVAFVNVSGWGNRMFLDNLRIGRACNSLSTVWQTTPNSCGPTCDGTATVTLPENNGGLNYQWEGWPTAHNLPTVYQLCPGEVTVTITDALGCEIIASTEILQAPSPEGNAVSTDVTSFGANDGTATVNITNGTPPFAFSWSNGMNANSNTFSNTISNLPEGEYAVTVTDEIGCSAVFEVEVGSVCAGFSLTVPVNHVTCFGGADGSATAQPINGQSPFEFIWSNGLNTQTINNLTAGDYTVTITDANDCPAEMTTTVEQPTELMLTLNSTNETSLGANDGTVSVFAEGGSPGYQYLWSNGSEMPAQTGLAPGEYSVIVTDLAGCQETATVNVLPFTCDDFTAVISWTNITCFGLEDGTAEVEVAGQTEPVSYMWSNGATAASLSNLSADEYAVTVSDAAGCGDELVAEIFSPSQIFANVASTDETAPGAEDGTASVSPTGGLTNPSSGYSVNWSNGAATFETENLAPGFYFVTVADANECEVLDTVYIQAANCNLSIETSVSPASCPNFADGLAIVTNVPGGATPLEYEWSNGDADPFAENLLPGQYFVTVTDANGCSAFSSVTVIADDSEAPVLALQNVVLEVDEDGLAFLNADDVDNGSTDNCSMVHLELSQMEFDCSDLGTVEVEVTGSDDNGNTVTETVTVTVADLIAPSITCPDDFTILSCDTVFYDLPLAEDNCDNVDIEFIDGFESGEVFPEGTTTVTYTATDFYDNSSSCSFDVTVEYDLSISLNGQSPTCQGDSDGILDLSISGGAAPYQTMWSHGGGTGDLPAGEYTVTVVDQNGCTNSETIELEDPPVFSAEVVNVTPAVNINSPGIISLNISGGVTPWVLTWFEDGVELPDFDPIAAPPGNYDLLVMDQNGCEIMIENIFVDNLNSLTDGELERHIELFPNPTHDIFYLRPVNLPVSKTTLNIYDTGGKLLLHSKLELVENQVHRIDVSDLGSGVFWVKIQMEDVVAWKKLVVF